MLPCTSVVVSTISSFTNCDGVCISCCVRFLVPFRFSLLFPVLSGKNEYQFKEVASTVSGYTLTQSILKEKVLIA